MKFEAGAHAIRFGDSGTFLGDVRRQAIDPTLWKVLTALFTRMRISITVVVELGAPDEVLEDEGIGFAAHCALKGVASA